MWVTAFYFNYKILKLPKSTPFPCFKYLDSSLWYKYVFQKTTCTLKMSVKQYQDKLAKFLTQPGPIDNFMKVDSGAHW